MIQGVMDRAHRMHQAHWDDELTLREVGVKFGCSHERVRQILNEAGLPVRTRKQARVVRQRHREQLAA